MTRIARKANASVRRWDRTLVALLLGGAVVRLLVMATYSTSVLNYYGGDSARFLRLPMTGSGALFSDPAMPAGYPLFLDGLQALSSELWFTMALQHLIGLATGAFAYVAVRQLGVPKLYAAIPAAIVIFDGDQIFLEHALLTEALWSLILMIGLSLALHALRDDRTAWLVAAGTVIAVSALVRHLSLVVPLLVALWAVVVLGGTTRERLVRGVAVLVPAVVVVAAYLVTASASPGGMSGLTQLSGFNLYARVGQFADCRKFDPPPGTAKLCETSDPDTRPGPYFYSYDPASPLYRAGFGVTPHDAPVLGRFARQAVLHQPWAYLRVVAKDTVRYFAPSVGADRQQVGAGPDQMSFGSLRPSMQGASIEQLAKQYAGVYEGVDAHASGATAIAVLDAYQQVFRVDGLLLLLAVALCLTACLRARGVVRHACLLLTGVGSYLLLAPPLLSSYDIRYGVMPAFLFSAGAALAAWSLSGGAGRAQPVLPELRTVRPSRDRVGVDP